MKVEIEESELKMLIDEKERLRKELERLRAWIEQVNGYLVNADLAEIR